MTSFSRAPGDLDGPAAARLESPDPARPDLAARRTAAVLLVVILVIVAVIVFWPGPPDPDGQSELQFFLFRAHQRGLPGWITFDLVQYLANVAMFAPIGLLGSLAMRRWNVLVVVYAAAASAAIEFVQLVLLPGRVATLSDVASNTLGAVVGLLLSVPALRRRRHRRRRYLLGRRSAADSARRVARVARF